MKTKLLFILALIVRVNSFAQIPACADKISILDHERDTVAEGDSIYIVINYTKTTTCYFPIDTGSVYMYDNSNVPKVLKSITMIEFNKLPKYNNGRKLYVTIPKGSPEGKAVVYAAIGSFSIQILKASGVDEQKAEKQVKEREYFDAMGRKTQSKDGLIIERIIYTDGSTSSNKLIKL